MDELNVEERIMGNSKNFKHFGSVFSKQPNYDNGVANQRND